MRHISLMLILLSLTIVSCGNKKNEFNLPENYRSWKKPVEKVLDYPVPGHGKSFRIIYANSSAYNSNVTKDRHGREQVVMPDGAIIVKEAYVKREDIGKKIRDITIMVKDSSDPRAKDGWLYFVKKGDAPIKFIGGRMCAGCHEAANESHQYFDGNKNNQFRDYLFLRY